MVCLFNLKQLFQKQIINTAMNEIININIGQAGCRIGQKFLEKIAAQHQINSNQPRGLTKVFFHDKQKNKQSRSIFMDFQQRSMDELKNRNQKNKQSPIIRQKNLISGKEGSQGLFSQSMYLKQGNQITQLAMQIIRKQAQQCDRLSGFLLIDSFGGGASSGFSSRILQKLREQYCYYIVQQFSVIPQRNGQCSPLHIYNSALSLSYKIEYSNLNVCVQNKACENILKYQERIHPSMQNVNDVLAQNVCQFTAPFRFSGSLNTNPRKLNNNLILFPRIKFLCSSHSSKSKQKSQNHIESALNPKSYLIDNFFQKATAKDDIYTGHLHCRDSLTYQQQMHSHVNKWMNNKDIVSTAWIPSNIHKSISDPIQIMKPKSNLLLNSKYIVDIYKRWGEQFCSLFRRRAFLYHYLSHSMDQMQFTEAQSNMNDLVSEYEPYNNYYDEDDQDYLGFLQDDQEE